VKAKLSPHLSWAELGCKDGTPYPAAWESRARRLAAVFEAYRECLGGKPIRIGSAYRTAAHNKRIGGVKTSQHVKGRALDCYPPSHLSLEEFHALSREFAREEPRIGGIGLYRWGVHWDLRARGSRLIVWNKLRSGTPLKDALV